MTSSNMVSRIGPPLTARQAASTPLRTRKKATRQSELRSRRLTAAITNAMATY